ncbi:MAG: MFS transporter, partial [Acidobacteriaceae bacterium]
MSARVHPARTAALALFLLTSLNLFNFIDRYVLPGVQPLIQREFHINDAQAGLLTSAFFFTYMLIAPLTGWLGDRFPRKPLIVAGALIWSAATLLTATVHSYHTLLIRHAAVGIGEATFSIFAPALLADFYPEEDRNRVLSIFYVTIPVGGALGYLTGGVLGDHYGWRMPFYVAAAPGVLIALAFWLFVREPQRGAADTLA